MLLVGFVFSHAGTKEEKINIELTTPTTYPISKKQAAKIEKIATEQEKKDVYWKSSEWEKEKKVLEEKWKKESQALFEHYDLLLIQASVTHYMITALTLSNKIQLQKTLGETQKEINQLTLQVNLLKKQLPPKKQSLEKALTWLEKFKDALILQNKTLEEKITQEFEKQKKLLRAGIPFLQSLNEKYIALITSINDLESLKQTIPSEKKAKEKKETEIKEINKKIDELKLEISTEECAIKSIKIAALFKQIQQKIINMPSLPVKNIVLSMIKLFAEIKLEPISTSKSLTPETPEHHYNFTDDDQCFITFTSDKNLTLKITGIETKTPVLEYSFKGQTAKKKLATTLLLTVYLNNISPNVYIATRIAFIIGVDKFLLYVTDDYMPWGLQRKLEQTTTTTTIKASKKDPEYQYFILFPQTSTYQKTNAYWFWWAQKKYELKEKIKNFFTWKKKQQPK